MSLPTLAQWLNLLVPGAGVVLIGRAWLGLLIGIVFAVLFNGAIVAVGLIPDEVGLTARRLLVLGAAASYILAQFVMTRVVRRHRQAIEASTRFTALRQAQQALVAGDAAGAWAALGPLLPLAETDLHVAYRVAQALSASGDAAAAAAAWEHLRALDRHHVYRNCR